MKNLLTLIAFLSLALSEDVYPQFSDINKQIEFGRKRIEITDYFEQGYQSKNKNREVLSIKVDNQSIDLIAFFNLIGSQEIVDELQTKYPDYNYLNERTFIIPESGLIRYVSAPLPILGYVLTSFSGLGTLGGGIRFLFTSSEFSGDKLTTILATGIVAGSSYLFWKFTKWSKTLQYKAKVVDDVTDIKLLSIQQIIDLAESYNLKLYNDIKN